MSRTVEVKANSAKEAEEKARDAVLFADESPIDRDDITDTNVGWVDPGEPVDLQIVHLEGCWGNHCRHYDCETGDSAIDHRAYCSQCDIEAY